MFQKTGATAFHEGLHNTLCLDEHFGHPHRKYPCIHIAGTNGKGSCSHSLASILQEAGYKVGLYTSPHLRDFRERIRVNGVCIDKDYVTRFVENERAFFEPLRPSFFELTTAMAFNYFAEQQAWYHYRGYYHYASHCRDTFLIDIERVSLRVTLHFRDAVSPHIVDKPVAEPYRDDEGEYNSRGGAH